MAEIRYDVDIVMVTYNQDKWVNIAIESVLSQNTSLNFRLIIGDDCSTDRTSSICESYAINFPEKILYLKSDKNKGIIDNYLRCFNQCTAELICILEGDDYWTDNFKLEKQYSLFNDNSIGLVHSNYLLYFEKQKKFKNTTHNLTSLCQKNQGFIFEVLMSYNFICPLTVMFRRKYIESIDFEYLIDNDINTIDYFLWLDIALKSKIVYEDSIYGVYRISDTSISNNSNFNKRIKFANTRIKILRHYIEKYPSFNLSLVSLIQKSNTRLFFRALKTLNIKYIMYYGKKISIYNIFSFLINYFKFNR